MTLSDRIKATLKALSDRREQLEALTVKLAEAPADDTILAQVDTLSAEIEAETKSLESLQRAEKALAARAQPLEGDQGGAAGGRGPLVLNLGNREKGSLELLVRGAVVAVESFHTRRPLAEVMRERYGDAGEATRIIVGMVTKAPTNPAMSNVAGYAAELVQQTYAAFMNALTGPAAVPAVPWTSVGTFDSGAPIVIPYRAQRSAFPANFDGAFRREGDPIRVGTLGTNSKTMGPYSMGVIGTFTKELFKRSTPNIEAVIRQAILDDTAEALDGYVFGNSAAVVGVRPPGLTNGLAGGDTRASSGARWDQINYDLQSMLIAMYVTHRLGKNPVWVMNTANKMALVDIANPMGVYAFREEVNAGKLKGLPIAASMNIDPTQVLLVDGGSIPFAGGVPVFEGSDQATLHEESQTPLPIGSAGAPATIAAPARSLFQTNSAAIKTVWEISWLQLYAGAVQQLTGVAWHPATPPTVLAADGGPAAGREAPPPPARGGPGGRAS